MVKVEKNEVLVLVDSIERPEEIDAVRAQREADQAREIILQKKSRQEYQIAQGNLARALNRLGLDSFCVATAEEGAALRQGGVRGSILVLGYTCVNIPYGTLCGAMTQNIDERAQLNTSRSVSAMIAIGVINIVTIPLIGFFGGGKLVKRFEKFGYNYNMYHFIDYGHEIAESMGTTFDLQLKFLETNVIRGQKRIIEAWVDDPAVLRGTGPQSRKELYSK